MILSKPQLINIVLSLYLHENSNKRAAVAQWVAPWTHGSKVVGSNPGPGICFPL